MPDHMQILEFDIDRYCAAESDLCKLHVVTEDDQHIEAELNAIQQQFSAAYPHLKQGKDYDYSEWHNHLRLFWVYLYSDEFYDPDFIPLIQALMASQDRSWFAEFECYSPSLMSPESPSGFVGDFLIYKQTVIFDSSDGWSSFRSKLGV